jgi:hypothetical protein
MEFLCRGRERQNWAILREIAAKCAGRNRLSAGYRKFSRGQIAGLGVPVREWTAGRQREFSSEAQAADREKAMYHTANCQEVHA